MVAPRVSVSTRLVEIWNFRETLVGLIHKELKVKYKNSVLGFAWSMLNPAMYLGVYYFVFQVVLKNGIKNFAIYLLCGLVVWNLFSTAVPNAATAVVGNSSIVKKVAFPREILALASVGASLVFFFFQAVVLIIALGVFRFIPVLSYLWLIIPAMLALLVLAAALGVFLSAVNVYLRDVQHLLELFMVLWFWATPIVYPYRQIADRLSKDHLAWLYLLNPVTCIVLVFQRALYGDVNSPKPGGGIIHLLPTNGPLWYLSLLLIVLVVSAALFIGALVVFGRLEGNFAEEL
ncbi:MAG: ABC transporter permease [Acidimicrobiales bacterium]